MPKIILIDPIGNETKVATFRADVEVFQCAAMLQAILDKDSKYMYVVEHKYKGSNRRTTPDRFNCSIGSLIHLYNSIKPMYI
jgi:hypothetical protein